jgi:hypothetical protein
MRSIIRLLSGRVAYERRAAIRAAELATANGSFDMNEAKIIMAFLLSAY